MQLELAFWESFNSTLALVLTGPILTFELPLYVFMYYVVPESAPPTIQPSFEDDTIFAIWTFFSLWISKKFQPYMFFLFQAVSLGNAKYTDFDTRFMTSYSAAATLAFYFYSLPAVYIIACALLLFTAPFYPIIGIWKIVLLFWEPEVYVDGGTKYPDDLQFRY